jgi:transcription initiation factor TFIIIB Brf1 subunit/transcription initiation factor TFIIB
MVQPKKKGFLKTNKGKQAVSNEEIVCKSCGLIIKTTTTSFN